MTEYHNVNILKQDTRQNEGQTNVIRLIKPNLHLLRVCRPHKVLRVQSEVDGLFSLHYVQWTVSIHMCSICQFSAPKEI